MGNDHSRGIASRGAATGVRFCRPPREDAGTCCRRQRTQRRPELCSRPSVGHRLWLGRTARAYDLAARRGVSSGGFPRQCKSGGSRSGGEPVGHVGLEGALAGDG